MKVIVLENPSGKVSRAYVCQALYPWRVRETWDVLLSDFAKELKIKLQEKGPTCCVYVYTFEKNESKALERKTGYLLGELPWAQAFVLFNQLAKRYNYGRLEAVKFEQEKTNI
jgi:hypothetical protein